MNANIPSMYSRQTNIYISKHNKIQLATGFVHCRQYYTQLLTCRQSMRRRKQFVNIYIFLQSNRTKVIQPNLRFQNEIISLSRIFLQRTIKTRQRYQSLFVNFFSITINKSFCSILKLICRSLNFNIIYVKNFLSPVHFP